MRFSSTSVALGTCIAVLVCAAAFIPLVDSYTTNIPPTRAFKIIFSGNNNVTARTYDGNVTFTPGTGMSLNLFYNNNTIRFTADLVNTITLEQLKNVTDIGCALGQTISVNSSAKWACTTFPGGTPAFTKINNLDGGTAKILATNSSFQATFKPLVAGTGISITNGSKFITIDATGSSGFTSINNMAGGTAKILATNSSLKANLKSLTAGSGVSITNGSTTLTISATGGSGISEINSMAGGTARLLKSNSTTEAVLKSLTQGTGITITNNTDTLTIAASGGGSDAMPTKRWGSFVPTTASTVGNGFLTTSLTLEGAETLIYNSTSSTNTLGISSTTPATGGFRWAGLIQNATNAFNIYTGAQNPYTYIHAAPSTKTVNNAKFFIGFKSNQTPLPRGDDLIVNGISAVGICTRTTDTNYQLCYNDGAGAGTYTSMGVADNTSWHRFEVYTTDSGVTWCGKIDGGTAVCTTTDIPVTTTRLYWQALLINHPQNIARIFQYGYVYVQNDR